MMQVNSILEKYNIKKGLDNESRKKVILVDCMDTIIKRNTTLRGIVGQWAKQVGKEFHLYSKFLYKYRVEVFSSAMHNTVPIEEIYGEMAEQCIYFGLLERERKNMFCKKSHEIEMSCELKSQSIVKKTANFLKEQKNKNDVKIYCVSDFRLPSDDIKIFFERQHIDMIFDGIFSSCDAGVTKKNGAFYPYVLNVLGVDSNECLMIGDNLEADCINASKNGIEGHWLHI